MTTKKPPVHVDIESVYPQNDCVYFRTRAGQLFVWGTDVGGHGVLGLGKGVSHTDNLTEINIPELRSFACTDKFCVALCETGKLYYWGNFFSVGGSKPLIPESKYFTPQSLLLEQPAVKVYASGCSFYLVSNNNSVAVHGTLFNNQPGVKGALFAPKLGDILSVSSSGIVHVEVDYRNQKNLVFVNNSGESTILATDVNQDRVKINGKMIVYFDLFNKQIILWEVFRFSDKKARKCVVNLPADATVSGVVTASICCSDNFLTVTIKGEFGEADDEVNAFGVKFGKVSLRHDCRSEQGIQSQPKQTSNPLLKTSNLSSRVMFSDDPQMVLRDLSKPDILDLSRISIQPFNNIATIDDTYKCHDASNFYESREPSQESFIKRMQDLQGSMFSDKHREQSSNKKIDCLRDRLDQIRIKSQMSSNSINLFAKNKRNFLGPKVGKLAEVVLEKLINAVHGSHYRLSFECIKRASAKRRLCALVLRIWNKNKQSAIHAVRSLSGIKTWRLKQLISVILKVNRKHAVSDAFVRIVKHSTRLHFVVPDPNAVSDSITQSQLNNFMMQKSLLERSSMAPKTISKLIEIEFYFTEKSNSKKLMVLMKLRNFARPVTFVSKLTKVIETGFKSKVFKKLKAHFILQGAFKGFVGSPIRGVRSQNSVASSQFGKQSVTTVGIPMLMLDQSPISQSDFNLSLTRGAQAISKDETQRPDHLFHQSPKGPAKNCVPSTIDVSQMKLQHHVPQGPTEIAISNLQTIPASNFEFEVYNTQGTPIRANVPMNRSGIQNDTQNYHQLSPTNPNGSRLSANSNVHRETPSLRNHLFEKSREFIDSNKHLFDFWRNEALTKLEPKSKKKDHSNDNDYSRYCEALVSFKRSNLMNSGDNSLDPPEQQEYHNENNDSLVQTRHFKDKMSNSKVSGDKMIANEKIVPEKIENTQKSDKKTENIVILAQPVKRESDDRACSSSTGDSVVRSQSQSCQAALPNIEDTAVSKQQKLDLQEIRHYLTQDVLPEIREETNTNEITQLSSSKTASRVFYEIQQNSPTYVLTHQREFPHSIKRFCIETPKQFDRNQQQQIKYHSPPKLVISQTITLVSSPTKETRNPNNCPSVRQHKSVSPKRSVSIIETIKAKYQSKQTIPKKQNLPTAIVQKEVSFPKQASSSVSQLKRSFDTKINLQKSLSKLTQNVANNTTTDYNKSKFFLKSKNSFGNCKETDSKMAATLSVANSTAKPFGFYSKTAKPMQSPTPPLSFVRKASQSSFKPSEPRNSVKSTTVLHQKNQSLTHKRYHLSVKGRAMSGSTNFAKINFLSGHRLNAVPFKV